jgi:hypothetical protein
MITKHCFTRIVLVLVSIGAMLGISFAQQQEENLDQTLESVRADIRADKVAIVSDTMNLKSPEADKFWPVYRQYETEVAKLNDKRIALLKDYAAKFSTMTDAEAKSMAERSFDWENSRTQLRKSYFDKFAKATSAMTAAKFFQIEHRLDLVMDLKLASVVPGLFVKSNAASQ